MTATITEVKARAHRADLAAQYRARVRAVAAAAGDTDPRRHDEALAELTACHRQVKNEDSSLATWLLLERCDFSELARLVRDGRSPAEIAPVMADWTAAYERTERYIAGLEV